MIIKWLNLVNYYYLIIKFWFEKDAEIIDKYIGCELNGHEETAQMLWYQKKVGKANLDGLDAHGLVTMHWIQEAWVQQKHAWCAQVIS